jgi:hypothetical protein
MEFGEQMALFLHRAWRILDTLILLSSWTFGAKDKWLGCVCLWEGLPASRTSLSPFWRGFHPFLGWLQFTACLPCTHPAHMVMGRPVGLIFDGSQFQLKRVFWKTHLGSVRWVLQWSSDVCYGRGGAGASMNATHLSFLSRPSLGPSLALHSLSTLLQVWVYPAGEREWTMDLEWLLIHNKRSINVSSYPSPLSWLTPLNSSRYICILSRKGFPELNSSILM